MNNKKKVIGVVIGLIIVLVVAIPIGTGKIKIGGLSPSKVAQNSSSEKDKSNQSANTKASADENSDKSDSNDGSNSSNGDSNSVTNSAGGDSVGGSSNNGRISGSSGDGSIANYSNTGQKVSSNYKIPDGDLKIQRVKGYTGIYIEDGSDKEIKNVVAIQVKNTSNKPIEYAQIQLYNGDNKLLFDVSTLPANSSAVVMEKNKTKFDSSKGVTYGGTAIAYFDKLEKSSDVKCSKVDNNGIKVTNKSKKDIPCVRVFYKFKSDGNYIGGITYTAKIEDLKAGKSQTVYPSHFVSDGGEIMMVKTYGSKN